MRNKLDYKINKARFKINPNEYDKIYTLYCEGYSKLEIAKRYNVTAPTITRIFKRKRISSKLSLLF